MENLKQKIQKLIDLLGFKEAEVYFDEERRRVSLLINDELIKKQTPMILDALDNLINLIARKNNQPPLVVDLNYYRKERERLIIELAKAAAHKAIITKEPVALPPMNAYERRLVHLEITANPSLTTESVGAGKERYVVIKYLD